MLIDDAARARVCTHGPARESKWPIMMGQADNDDNGLLHYTLLY